MSSRAGFTNFLMGLLIAVAAIWIGFVLIPKTVKQDLYALSINSSRAGGPTQIISGSASAKPGIVRGIVSVECRSCNSSQAMSGRQITFRSASGASTASVSVSMDGAYEISLPGGSYYADMTHAPGEQASPLPGYIVVSEEKPVDLNIVIRIP